MTSSINNFRSVMRDLEKAEQHALSAAASHMKKKLKENLSKKHGPSAPGDMPGYRMKNLIKGVGTQKAGPHKQLVGVGRPGRQAHLLEFGTANRIVKNYMGKKGVTKNIGPMAPRPFFAPTFEQEKGEVQKILSEKWL